VENRDRFNKFTERARKVLTLAQEEAQRFQHNYIGTEHLLLGLVSEGEGVAAKVLTNLGIRLSDVRKAVEYIIGRGDRITPGEIGLTPRAKKVIELAVDEAKLLKHQYIRYRTYSAGSGTRRWWYCRGSTGEHGREARAGAH